jgi:hypothetical protein
MNRYRNKLRMSQRRLRIRWLKARRWWLRKDHRYAPWWRIGNGVVAVVLVASIVMPIVQQQFQTSRYKLSADALKLVGTTNQNLTKQLTFDGSIQTYQFNQAAIKDTSTTNPVAKMQHQVGTASGSGKDKSLYALDVPTDFSKGVTYHDINSQLDFSLVPQFSAQAAKQEQGHIVFPLDGGNQAVYTLKNNGLKEDIVIPKATNDTERFSYTLNLPKTLQAKVIPDSGGAIGIYSADPSLFGNISYSTDNDKQLVEKARENSEKTNLVFGLPAPVIKTTDGNEATTATAQFELSGDSLSVVATGLKSIPGAFTVDPSVVVTSTSDFQTKGNNEGNIDFSTSGQINRAGITGGSLAGGFSTATTSGAFTTARAGLGSVAYNGYLYVLGGSTTSGGGYLNTAQYSAIGSTGTLGAWSSTTSFTTARSEFGIVAYNGYLYIAGGAITGTNAAAFASDVQYAPINSNGTIGTWTATTSLPSTRSDEGAVVYNGYMYILGGSNAYDNGPGNTGGSLFNDVQYAPINADGTVGTWTSTTAFTTARFSFGAAAYNGYIYIAGGNLNGTFVNDVQYAPLKADGTVGTWTTTTAFTTARSLFGLVIANGYMYIGGGLAPGSYFNDVQYAPIKANGTVGAWTFTSTFTNVRASVGFVNYNGYMYVLGGIGGTGTTFYNDTQYAKIDSAGMTQAWTKDTTHTVAAALALNCAVAYNGRIYSIGGSTSDSSSNAVTTVQSATLSAAGVLGTFSTTNQTALPAARSGQSCVAYDDTIFVIGGYAAGTADGAVLSSVINLSNGGTAAWSTLNDMHTSGTPVSGSALVSNGYLYSVGGTNSGGSGTNTAVYYALLCTTLNSGSGGCGGTAGTVGTWAAANSLPNNYTGQTYATVNGYLYVYGGVSGGTAQTTVDYALVCTGNNSGTAGCSSTAGTLGTWTATNSLPAGIQAAGGATMNGCIYSVGGKNGSGTSQAAVYYACPNADGTIGASGSGSWQTAPSLVTATTDAGVTSQNGYLYAVAGFAAAVVNSTQQASTNNGGSGTATAATWTSANGTTTGSDLSTPYSLGIANEEAFVYGGYLYTVSGYDGTTRLTTVWSAPLSAVNGTVGTWTQQPSLNTAHYNGVVQVYNGYAYVYTGINGSGADTNTYEYAKINSGGGLGSWSADTTMNFASGSVPIRDAAAGAVYNGYLYLLGGNHTTTYYNDVIYAPLNSDGTVGTWHYTHNSTDDAGTFSAGFANSRYGLYSFAYNGYLYMLGGRTTSSGTYMSDVQYAKLNSNGTVGTWQYTSSLMQPRAFGEVVFANGFVYAMGGTNAVGGLVDIEQAPITANGTLGAWEKSDGSVYTTARSNSAAILYNGYVYQLGGFKSTGSVYFTDVQFSPVNSMSHIAHYSSLIDLGSVTNITSVTYNGTVPGDKSNVAYKAAGSNGVFSSSGQTNAISGSGGCVGNLQAMRYIWVTITLDDSTGLGTGGIFADNSSNANVTDFSVNYSPAHPAPNIRLRGGQTLQTGTLSALDTCIP